MNIALPVAAAPLWYGEWGMEPAAIKALETRELIAEDYTYVYGYKARRLLYKSSANGGMANTNYVFGDNGLAHCTISIMTRIGSVSDLEDTISAYMERLNAKMNDADVAYLKAVPEPGANPNAEVTLVKAHKYKVMLISWYNDKRGLLSYDINIFNPDDDLNKEWLAIFDASWDKSEIPK